MRSWTHKHMDTRVKMDVWLGSKIDKNYTKIHDKLIRVAFLSYMYVLVEQVNE